ncbi:hypothetical protein BRADI_3g54150v3 [Brachypodium distachyon]|uniref:Borealin C-terminal domain-containing protein n=1 Tax=Brachypodium distachyon TaxID=15368 RepID=A0A0Q3FPR1_BRADI|nr:hypothetical protein BRADI_3g54150v3 [Brachypodium distachyon]
MPPRRKRRGAAPTAKQQQPAPPGADAPLEEQLRWSIHQEVERRKAAIRAIQVAETESVLSRLRLVRSYISKEQEETCALQFFQENLPNLSVVRNEKEDELELKWKDFDDQIIGDERDDKISRASIPAATGFQFSADSVQKNFKEITETPGAMSSRLSFGMTPKTVRLPKPGEMLLSVHGSPLGMYKEDNLAAITESANASGDAAS